MKGNDRSTRTYSRLSSFMSGSRYSEMLIYIRYRMISGSSDTDMWTSCVSIVSGFRNLNMWIVHSFFFDSFWSTCVNLWICHYFSTDFWIDWFKYVDFLWFFNGFWNWEYEHVDVSFVFEWLLDPVWHLKWHGSSRHISSHQQEIHQAKRHRGKECTNSTRFEFDAEMWIRNQSFWSAYLITSLS